jgi:hypothetical protein
MGCICAIFGFLFFANIVAYNWNLLQEDLESWGVPVQCVFDRLPGHYLAKDVSLLVISSLFLAWGLYAVARDLYPDTIDEFGTNLGKVLTPIVQASVAPRFVPQRALEAKRRPPDRPLDPSTAMDCQHPCIYLLPNLLHLRPDLVLGNGGFVPYVRHPLLCHIRSHTSQKMGEDHRDAER